MTVRVLQAHRAEHHARICQVARSSRYTSSFSSIMFSSEAAYEKGWIRTAWLGHNIVGFTCVRHKVLAPETILYFIAVDPLCRNEGVGQVLMKDLEQQTPHQRITLNVMHTNRDALRFYERLGYRVVAEDAVKGTAWRMVKELD